MSESNSSTRKRKEYSAPAPETGKGYIVVQQNAPFARVLSVRPCAEAPLFDSCSGHIFLAFAEDADREEMSVTNEWSNR